MSLRAWLDAPPGNGARRGTVLVDGDYRADWRIDSGGVLTVTPFTGLGPAEKEEIMTEGAALLAFVLPGAEHDVHIG